MSDRVNSSSVTLILTTNCNMSCSYCYQRVREPRAMEWDVAKAGADLALSRPGRKVELTFYGGEPLLEFELMRRVVDHVERARERRSVQYWVVTNGALITDEIVTFLAEHEFKVLLSFDGVREAQDIRGEGTFDTLDGTLDLIRETRPDYYRRAIEISVTVSPEAVPFMADSVDYFFEKGVCELDLTPVITPRSGWSKARLLELEGQFERILASSLKHLERTGDILLKLYSGVGMLSGPPVTSRAMCEIVDSNSWAVDVDGAVSGCTLFAPSIQAFESGLLRDSRSALVLGNITDPGLAERMAAFAGEVGKLHLFSEKEKKYSSYRRCADCRFFAVCVTCPVSTGFAPGNTDPHRVPDYYCAFNYTALASRDGFPVQPTDLEVIRGDRFKELRLKWKQMGDGAREESTGRRGSR